ncbi:cytochrome c oxidase subunit II [Sphingomicrobium sediminis]|uniref:Cytochrome c oxidase subunit 2 n=1 Tax=Sphingomicrobium sediminis TaxID=2950949 RepID=A0A9X2J2H7_9SPHN|nr:cytochrome c oxidase subunit II [Sphingomicrobium sediminis]MCM8558293.1 cytochrome c oxidase subunit II [Sphingomicrobium sediminis]
MILKRWLLALLAITLLPNAAMAAVDTPIGELVAVQPDLDGTTADEAAAEIPDWVGLDATEGYYGPSDAARGIQTQVTEVGQQAQGFHDNMLLPIITAISIFVLILMIYAMVRFRRAANPEPSRTTHNTAIEVIWTLVPVLILLVIAVPSIGLIRAQYDQPPADVVIKVTGQQWHWDYEYPDHGEIKFSSYMLREEDDPDRNTSSRPRTDADGPALLAVDERVVIPAGKVVKLIITADPGGVIHSFAMPAFWLKMDAVPGRLNETWVKVDEPGLYFGQCSELCGARHAYMPIAIEVVSDEEFEAWVASKGGAMPEDIAAAAAAEEAADAANDNDEAADDAADTTA